MVRVDDPLASRAHACLHVGEAMFLEDVGSVNGTRVKDQPLKPGERVSIAIGDTIQIGSSVLIVQRRTAPAELIRPETLRDEGPGAAIRRRPRLPRAGEAMQRVHALAERAAAGTINVLITGETGVGKELLAETVHRASPRRDGPYVCLNCAALSETLLESELFGHERGAFTGAVAAKPGLLETAAGGTVFLDEVGELPLATQAKLLRVIETREVTRLGSVQPRRIDVRFIAATNRDLEAEVARGAFRQDLYFRLNGITLTIPPLRARVERDPPARRAVRAPDLPRPRPRAAGAAAGDLRAARVVRLAGEHPRAQERRSSGRCCSARARSSSREHLPLDKLAPRTAPGSAPRRASTRRRCRRRTRARPDRRRRWPPAPATRAAPPSCSASRAARSSPSSTPTRSRAPKRRTTTIPRTRSREGGRALLGRPRRGGRGTLSGSHTSERQILRRSATPRSTTG